MKKHLYLRLALTNIRKNGRFYVPFLLTGIAAVAMFFILLSTGLTQTLPGGQSMLVLMHFGVIIIGLFSAVFLYYTNSFLIRRRKRELGLYNVLGMEKRHIARVLRRETLVIALICIAGGIGTGIVLDRLMFLVLLNLTHMDVSIRYELQPAAIVATAAVFAVIFLLILLANLLQIRKAKPVELLHSANAGEREPKVKWPLVVIGVLSLGSGYYLSITTTNALQALGMFFVAVLLVILGTYCLFVAGSIAILKLLKRRSHYYYQARHFVSVSGMLYRMKQNAVGLANICILSTMVLVTVSTTASLYGGMQDMLDARYPADIVIAVDRPTAETEAAVEQLAQETFVEEGRAAAQVQRYESLTVSYSQTNEGFVCDGQTTNMAYVEFFTPQSFEALTGRKLQLQDNEVAAYVHSGRLPERFTITGEEYTVAEYLPDRPVKDELSGYVANIYYMVVSSDAVLDRIDAAQRAVYGERIACPKFYAGYNLDGTDEQIIACSQAVADRLKDGTDAFTLDCRQSAAPSFYAMYGSFLFLGIFLGLLFMMATVLIIYYKQIIEGYDDRTRFEIMQKVGMDKRLIASSVRSQVLILFALPIAAAALHLVFAFPMLTRLLKCLNLQNVRVFAIGTGVTLAVYVLIYVAVYILTARSYYSIVSRAEKA